MSREKNSSLEIWFQLLISIFSTSTDGSTTTNTTFQEFVRFSSFKLRGTGLITKGWRYFVSQHQGEASDRRGSGGGGGGSHGP